MIFIEIFASILGVISVWFTIMQNILCWPIGIVMVTFYIIVFYHAHLYSAAVLQIIYIFLQIYGWYNWCYGGQDNQKLCVSRITFSQVITGGAMAILGITSMGFFMGRYTNAELVYADAATTVLSLIGQWFMAKKILECWFIWMIVNVMAVGIYLVKALYVTAGLYFLFFILAIIGFWEWRRAILVEKNMPKEYCAPVGDR